MYKGDNMIPKVGNIDNTFRTYLDKSLASGIRNPKCPYCPTGKKGDNFVTKNHLKSQIYQVGKILVNEKTGEKIEINYCLKCGRKL